eukprot:CAMPEP_0181237988 /NCGR_PEP_ID=MMETSP1096-20121128/39077_1 /TAXON_ID=156174 ORGANISM="Chrysochromulina ericina, Strain CCMP281" /NCGR_SAMPLE_ID=MMETSP1096 /ASSEMBLY_ACC=CAM_ASM_000453 /LENGTH=92 /DNA_ID=CAMNT_0023333421 /DNA_START=249 /DNA_END=524 /DNA_ORIENTATION=+
MNLPVPPITSMRTEGKGCVACLFRGHECATSLVMLARISVCRQPRGNDHAIVLASRLTPCASDLHRGARVGVTSRTLTRSPGEWSLAGGGVA